MRAVLVCFALWALAPGAVFAHALAPILVRVDEAEAGRVRVRWTLSTTGAGFGLAADGTPLTLLLPERCQPQRSPGALTTSRMRTTDERFECGGALGGATLRIERLAQARQPVVLRYRGPDGIEHVRTLAGDDDRWTLPAAGAPSGSAFAGFARYVHIGVEHILGGWDHLAFVLCLAVVAGALRPLLWAVTAFTLAHSLSLAGVVLGYLRLPAAPVEACIALSVVLVAVQATGRASAGPARVSAITSMAFAFGLLHGLGFGGALSDVGFAGTSLAAGLAGFNVGVELGQLAVLALLLTVRLAWLRLLQWPRGAGWVERAAVEVAGVAAGYWFVERVLSFTAA